MITNTFDSVFSTLKNLTEDLSKSIYFNRFKEQLKQLHPPRFEWPILQIGNLTARVPIVQGGMGVGISLSSLASAVAEAGGIGIIAANAIGMIEPDYYKDGRVANLRALHREIRTARKNTDGIIGVNIMVAVNDFQEMLDAAIEEKVDLIVMGAGLPIKNLPVGKMRQNGVKAVPVVSSVRATKLIFSMWKKIYGDVPDAVVFEGPKAGGHLGFTIEQVDDPDFQLEAIVPGIIEALIPFEKEFSREIPVIVGGGIYTGEDIHNVLKLGASAVQMGTRFVATEECDADDQFKQSYVECTKEQIGLIKSPVGMPGRAIRNKFIEDVESGRRPSFTCAWKCLSSCQSNNAKYCISIALDNARRGRNSQGFVFAGTNAYRVNKIVPVASLIEELSEAYQHKVCEGMLQPLESIVNRIQDLRIQHDGIVARVQWFHARILEVGESGASQLYRKYDTMLIKLKGLQNQIFDGLTASWKLLIREKSGFP